MECGCGFLMERKGDRWLCTNRKCGGFASALPLPDTREAQAKRAAAEAELTRKIARWGGQARDPTANPLWRPKRLR
ncbi:MAG TPA: hypothetical protein VM370_09805 [Candidatus Thermoplasmatota archaeon]|nr:hypothetical protein [Candidatus Thermoplasmatota archaeon]